MAHATVDKTEAARDRAVGPSPARAIDPLKLFDRGGAASLRKQDVVTTWGEEAQRLLAAITTGEYRKKRRTLLALAHAAYAGVAYSKVFALDSAYTGSRTVHYEKWLRDDPAYRAAFEYLCRRGERLGLALLRRDTEFADEEMEALAALERSRQRLALLSERAVDTLEAAMQAEDADWNARIRAAKEVLDRPPATAPAQRMVIEDDNDVASEGGIGRVVALLERARARRDKELARSHSTAADD